MNGIKNMLRNLGISSLVMSKDIGRKYFNDSLFDITFDEDARSAAFFAYGKAQREDRLVGVITTEDQLSHCYSAMTEAMFQHVRFVIVVLHDGSSSLSHEYLNACKIAEFDFGPGCEKQIQEIGENRRGPILVNVKVGKDNMDSEEKVDLDSLAAVLSLNANDTVICYDKYSEGLNNHCRVYTFSDGQKYGAISRYMGFLTGWNDRCILIMPVDFFQFDLNILNNRYLNERFKVIMVDMERVQNRHRNWIQKNGILYTELKLNELETKKCFRSDKPEICFLDI